MQDGVEIYQDYIESLINFDISQMSDEEALTGLFELSSIRDRLVSAKIDIEKQRENKQSIEFNIPSYSVGGKNRSLGLLTEFINVVNSRDYVLKNLNDVIENINNIIVALKDKSEENVAYVQSYVNDWLNAIVAAKIDKANMMPLYEAEELRNKTLYSGSAGTAC
jgi:hypothetical protein